VIHERDIVADTPNAPRSKTAALRHRPPLAARRSQTEARERQMNSGGHRGFTAVTIIVLIFAPFFSHHEWIWRLVGQTKETHIEQCMPKQPCPAHKVIVTVERLPIPPGGGQGGNDQGGGNQGGGDHGGQGGSEGGGKKGKH
jgi:uncharacterized membrane protein YgcG